MNDSKTMTSTNTLSKSVNAWIYLDEDDPSGAGYNSPNSSYQSLVNNNVYKYTDVLFVCFFDTVPDGKNYFSIEIGNATVVHPGGLTTKQYLQNVINDSRKQNPNIKVLATLNYNQTSLSKIFSLDSTKWNSEAGAFAKNLYSYLNANQMNGFDIDWEGDFAYSITSQQFAILFSAIRSAFNADPDKYFYLTLSPASVGNLDGATVNSCFDFVNLQLYSGFTSPNDFISAGVTPDLLGYGAQFEKGYGIWQNADQAYAGYLAGFKYNNVQYPYKVLTQWRLNSNNFIYEQSQQILIFQFIHGVQNFRFDDTGIISNAGNPTISSLQINSGDVLDALQVTNISPNSTVFGLLQHGGNGGGSSSIMLQKGDLITQISGYNGVWYGWNCVVQITIKTKNGNVYGPFGSMQNVSSQTPFTFNAPSGQSIVAFSGETVCVPEARGTISFVVSKLNVSYSG